MHTYRQLEEIKIENIMFWCYLFPLEMFQFTCSRRGQGHEWFCPLGGQWPCDWLKGDSSISTLSYFPASLPCYLCFDRIISSFFWLPARLWVGKEKETKTWISLTSNTRWEATSALHLRAHPSTPSTILNASRQSKSETKFQFQRSPGEAAKYISKFIWDME